MQFFIQLTNKKTKKIMVSNTENKNNNQIKIKIQQLNHYINKNTSKINLKKCIDIINLSQKEIQNRIADITNIQKDNEKLTELQRYQKQLNALQLRAQLLNNKKLSETSYSSVAKIAALIIAALGITHQVKNPPGFSNNTNQQSGTITPKKSSPQTPLNFLLFGKDPNNAVPYTPQSTTPKIAPINLPQNLGTITPKKSSPQTPLNFLLFGEDPNHPVPYTPPSNPPKIDHLKTSENTNPQNPPPLTPNVDPSTSGDETHNTLNRLQSFLNTIQTHISNPLNVVFDLALIYLIYKQLTSLLPRSHSQSFSTGDFTGGGLPRQNPILNPSLKNPLNSVLNSIPILTALSQPASSGLQMPSQTQTSSQPSLQSVTQTLYTNPLSFSNQGNDCFFNSATQMLFAIPEIRQAIIDQQAQEQALIQQPPSILTSLRNALRSTTPVSVNSLRRAIDLDDGEQHDIHEALLPMLNALNLEPISAPFVDYTRLLDGRVNYEDEALADRFEHARHQPLEYPEHVLDITSQRLTQPKKNLRKQRSQPLDFNLLAHEALSSTSTSEVRHYESNQIVQATRHRRYDTPPPILTFYIPRFEVQSSQNYAENQAKKNSRTIALTTTEFTLPPENIRNAQVGESYELMTYAIHTGTIAGGHWVAYSRVISFNAQGEREDRYYSCDDDQITEITAAQFLSNTKHMTASTFRRTTLNNDPQRNK